MIRGHGGLPALSAAELNPRARGARQGTLCAGQAVPAMGFHLEKMNLASDLMVRRPKTFPPSKNLETSHQLPVKKADIWSFFGDQFPNFDLSGSDCKPTSTLFVPALLVAINSHRV